VSYTAVYFVKPGDENNELKFSLRSVDKNLDVDDVVIVGSTPSWVKNVTSIRGNRYANKEWAIKDNLMILAEHPSLPDEVLVMNDDFFLMKPYEYVSEYRGSLRDQFNGLGNRGGWWGTSLGVTLDWLESQGVKEPRSYEIHKPVLMNRTRLAEALHRMEPVYPIPQWRTVYGNLHEVEAVVGVDCKVSKPSATFDKNASLLSTEDIAFAQGDVGKFIRSKFRKPSRYERG
jgi:hypothetical protein